MGNMGWVEIVLFYGLAITFGVWQYVSTSRTLARTRAAREAKEAAERDPPRPRRSSRSRPCAQPRAGRAHRSAATERAEVDDRLD